MPKTSAGLLMYRFQDERLEVFLVHPGGPFFKNKNIWGIPKGEQHDDEDLLETAKREFSEETGINLKPNAKYYELGSITYPNGKIIYAWAFEDGSFNPGRLVSNTFKMKWPPVIGKLQEFPEIDKGDYFPLEEASKLINPAQKDFLARLKQKL